MKSSEIIIVAALVSAILLLATMILCSHFEAMKKLDVEIMEIGKLEMSQVQHKKGIW